MHTPYLRWLSLLLVAQPVLWMSDVALAQTLQQITTPPPGPTIATAGPTAPGDTEIVRGDRGTVAVSGPAVPAMDEPLDPDRYVCGPGDVLELNFWGLQNFKLRATVDLEGRAFVPKVGFFKLQGKTLTEARSTMRNAVGSLYPRLNFEVTLAEPRTFLVQVAEDVLHPAAYPARALDRVSTVIAKAGGFGPGASLRKVEVRRRDGKVLVADLLMYTLTGDVKHNPYLLDGDVVRVPFESLAATIGGAVNRPGRYELIGSRDLAELVQLAGGFAPGATQQLPVRVVRRMPDDRQQQELLPFDGGQLPALAMQHEDIVTIPSVTELQQSVTVIGAITGAAAPVASAPGLAAPDESSTTRRLPFVKGDSVRTLLERVGGVGPLADLTGAYLLRDGVTLPVDLYALVMVRDLKADKAVQLGDTLVIPFKRRNVSVEGAVFRPGAQPFNPAFGVEQYLSLAGGRNRNAEGLDDVRVITPDGKTSTFEPGLPVQPGSSLVVPERTFTRSELVQIGLSVAGIVLSGVAAVLAARK